MGRPTSKAELIASSTEQFSKLWLLIDRMSEEEQEADFKFTSEFLEKKKEAHWRRDRNLRDVLIHLYEWQQLLLNWVASNQKGVDKPFLPEPYNWKTYGQMNIEFMNKHQDTSLNEAKALLKNSHIKVLAMIDSFTNEELFVKKMFSWTGSTNLGSYCISSTSSHYEWAIKKIRQHNKLQKKA